MNQWIKVGDRLPVKGMKVLASGGKSVNACVCVDDDGSLKMIDNPFWLYPKPEWGDGYEAWVPYPAPFDEIKQSICDEYCKWPFNTENQKELNEICEKCPLDRL